MATKLKGLAVTGVDLVDQGANPDAHIRLFKRGGNGSESRIGKLHLWCGNDGGTGSRGAGTDTDH